MSINLNNVSREEALRKVSRYFSENPDCPLVALITTNYSIFEFLTGNREIVVDNVRKIKKSIVESGQQNCIVVDSLLQIRDGQHRFIALQELCEEEGIQRYIKVVIDNTLTVNKFNIIMNEVIETQNSVKWNLGDYLHSYVEMYLDGDLSKEKYYLFDKWLKNNSKLIEGFRLDDLVAMSMDTESGSKEKFKSHFVFSECNLYTNIRRVLQFSGAVWFNNAMMHRLVTCLNSLYKADNFNSTRVENLINKGSYPSYANNIAMFKQSIMEWYNYGVPEARRVYLKTGRRR